MRANTTTDLRKGFMEWLLKIDTHKYYMAGPMFLSSYEYLKDEGKKKPIQNLIRFENFKHDLNRILNRLNMTTIDEIPIINNSNNTFTMMTSTYRKLQTFRLLNMTNIYDDDSIQ